MPIALLPDCALLGLILTVLLVELFAPSRCRRRAVELVASLGLVGVAILLVATVADHELGTWCLRSWTAPFKLVVLVSALLSIGMMPSYFATDSRRQRLIRSPGIVIFLMLVAVLGTFVVSSASDLIGLFMGLELTAIPMYVIAAAYHDRRSSEASIKYLLLGSIGTALFVFGCSYLYGAAGHLDFSSLAQVLEEGDPLAVIGAVAVTMALMFKLAAAPAHMWAPDVYEGAPTPSVAYIASGSKASGLVALILLLDYPLLGLREGVLLPVVLTVAGLSLVIGNLGALRQQNFNRFMAYSSVSQVGFFLVALAAADETTARAAIAFYVIVYCLSNYLAFYVYNCLTADRPASLDALRGLGVQSPILALCLLLAMFSLAGIPPLAGFIGKLGLLLSAATGKAWWLILLAAGNAVVALFYYLTIIRRAYLDPVDEPPGPVLIIAVQRWALAGLAVTVLGTGIWSGMHEWVFRVSGAVPQAVPGGSDAIGAAAP